MMNYSKQCIVEVVETIEYAEQNMHSNDERIMKAQYVA